MSEQTVLSDPVWPRMDHTGETAEQQLDRVYKARDDVIRESFRLAYEVLALEHECGARQAQLADRDAEIERLRETLAWYAGNNSWQSDIDGLGEHRWHPKIRDCGQRARAALAPHAAPDQTEGV